MYELDEICKRLHEFEEIHKRLRELKKYQAQGISHRGDYEQQGGKLLSGFCPRIRPLFSIPGQRILYLYCSVMQTKVFPSKYCNRGEISLSETTLD